MLHLDDSIAVDSVLALRALAELVVLHLSAPDASQPHCPILSSKLISVALKLANALNVHGSPTLLLGIRKSSRSSRSSRYGACSVTCGIRDLSCLRLTASPPVDQHGDNKKYQAENEKVDPDLGVLWSPNLNTRPDKDGGGGAGPASRG